MKLCIIANIHQLPKHSMHGIYASLTPETTTRLRPHICVRMRAYVSGMKQIGHESTESTWEVVGGDWTPLGHVQGNCKGSCVFL